MCTGEVVNYPYFIFKKLELYHIDGATKPPHTKDNPNTNRRKTN